MHKVFWYPFKEDNKLIQKVAKDYNFIATKTVAFCGDNAKVNFGGLTPGGQNESN